MSRHPLALLTSLYAAQGLPFGFFTLALPVVLREAGWSLHAIGWLQMLALPWALKFAWAPVVDQHGSRRAWLVSLQGAACVMALGMAWLAPDVGWVLLLGVLLFNVVAATQDIVTDGLAVRLLGQRERGLANAIQVGAYRLGMVMGGGGLLWLLSQSDWPTMFLCMAALLALLSIPAWLWRDPLAATNAHNPSKDDIQAVRGAALLWAWWARLRTPGMLTMVALIFAYRFGDQMVSALITPFIADQGVSKADIALMKGALGSGCSLLGAVFGGVLLWRWSRRTALLTSGLAQAVAFGLYLSVALGWGGISVLWVATVCESIVGTVATVALFALMMDASDPEHAGTDFTLLASVVVGVGSFGGIVGGAVGDAWGYGWAFGVGTVLSVLGCLTLVMWLDRHPTHERVSQAWR